MNSIDGSDHYNKTSDEPSPSLLTVILDTNPHAWALLEPTLPLTAALASLFVFINAHLAFNNDNQVAVVASHTQRAAFLYPPTPDSRSIRSVNGSRSRTSIIDSQNGHQQDSDEDMADAGAQAGEQEEGEGEDERDQDTTQTSNNDANHYRPFRQIQETILTSLKRLFSETLPESLSVTTSIAGALTLALTHINKAQMIHASSTNPSSTRGAASAGGNATSTATTTTTSSGETTASSTLLPRILILSVSGDLAHQYIPIMNTIFACQRLSIPIDIAKLAGDTVFLQQASDATRGTYMRVEKPQGLLQYLMMGFLPDQTARRFLVPPTAVGVDFRAACFCHRRVVDVGFVCSICLSSEFLFFSLFPLPLI